MTITVACEMRECSNMRKMIRAALLDAVERKPLRHAPFSAIAFSVPMRGDHARATDRAREVSAHCQVCQPCNGRRDQRCNRRKAERTSETARSIKQCHDGDHAGVSMNEMHSPK